MKLIDKEENSLQLANFFHHRLDSLLKLTAILCARDHEGEIQGDDLLVAQNFGDVSGSDFLCEPFDDGGFSDTCFPDQHGIVFGAATKNLNDAFDLIFTANNGIHFPFAGQLG